MSAASVQLGYWIALGALVLVTALQGNRSMLRTTLAILAVGLGSLLLSRWLVWPSDPYSLGMLMLDGFGAWIVLWRPAGAAQGLIGGTFLAQAAFHAAKLWSGERTDIYSYWAGLSLLAILQLLLIGGWWFNERVDWSGAVHRTRRLARTEGGAGRVKG